VVHQLVNNKKDKQNARRNQSFVVASTFKVAGITI